jgi:O-antigen ligase
MSSDTVSVPPIESPIFQRFRFWLLVLLAFTVTLELSPAFIILPALSIVMVVVSDRFNLRLTATRVSSLGYFLTLIFLIHAAWFLPHIIRTGSTKYLERTLPYLLFPLMISTTPLDDAKLKKVLQFFIGSVVVSYVLSILAAVYHYFYSVPRWGRASDFFFHEQFTQGLFNIHPTYYSLLGCVATLLAFVTLTKTWRILIVFFLTVVILLINARSTLVIQLLLIFSFILKGFSNGFSIKRLLVLLASGIVLFFVMRAFSSIYDYPHRKLLINLEGAWTRSFAPDVSDGDGGIVMRLAIWRNAYSVIQDHPILGVGLGYEEQYLVSEYKKNNVAYLAGSALNAHNQGLSYLIGFGVLGFALLGVVYFRLLSEAYKSRCRIYFVFIGTFVCVALTESIFNRLLGISLFAFVNALIMLKLVHHDK